MKNQFIHLRTTIGGTVACSAYFGPFIAPAQLIQFFEDANAEFKVAQFQGVLLTLDPVPFVPEGDRYLRPHKIRGFFNLEEVAC